uniref:FA core complex associated protein 100 n=1 Tax=Gasterosteus aculeatus aculeatus TaxID=481459 RepID=A0AAQ4QTA7_GASAC
VMEGRCAVETWAEFGFSGTPCAPWLQVAFGTDVLLFAGTDEVFVFSSHERKLTVTSIVSSYECVFSYVTIHLCRAGSPPADAHRGPAELKLTSEFLAFAEEGVLSLLLVGSVLLTLSQRRSSWTLTLYGSSDYEVLRSVSLASGVVHNETGTRRRPPLTCVRSSAATPPPSASSSVSDGCLCLEPILFKRLFGIDAALAKSPVVLCGLPDGRLCFLPLRPPGSRLAVLHSLEQPVVFVGASGVTDNGRGHARCLVAVGEQGKVVLIQAEKGGAEGGADRTGFTEGCVPGPVACGCVDEKRLYYSTGSDLLVLDLPEESPERDGPSVEKSRVTHAALQSPSSLNVCRVLALAPPTRSTAGEVELLGLSARGQLQRITLPVDRGDAGWPNAPSTPGGRGVRDLLSAIGDVCERAAALKAAVKSKNQILRRLNQVLNICFLLTADTNTGERDKPIGCRATASWSRLLEEDSLTLTCVLDNSSPYVLERGWTLSVAASPLSGPPAAGGQSPSAHFSFPFHGLHPGETLEVSLPLAAAGQSSLPVTASCSLSFSLAGLLGEEAAALPGLQPGCVSLPLNTLTVDWLHALRVTSPAHGKTPPQSGNTSDAIQAFLRSRRMGCDVGLSLSVVHGRDPSGHPVKLTAKEVKDRTLNPRRFEEETTPTAVEVQVESSSVAAVCGLHHAVLTRIQVPEVTESGALSFSMVSREAR